MSNGQDCDHVPPLLACTATAPNKRLLGFGLGAVCRFVDGATGLEPMSAQFIASSGTGGRKLSGLIREQCDRRGAATILPFHHTGHEHAPALGLRRGWLPSHLVGTPNPVPAPRREVWSYTVGMRRERDETPRNFHGEPQCNARRGGAAAGNIIAE